MARTLRRLCAGRATLKVILETGEFGSPAKIREAAELLLQAKVISIRTVKVPAKAKRLGRWMGHTSAIKKATTQ